jgi:Fic family protein
MTDGIRRHSVASEAPVITDPLKQAEAEALNGLLQFDLARNMIVDALDKQGKWRLRPSTILSLHRQALQGISNYAGNFRPASVEIQGSKHRPVDAFRVPELVEDMCDYVNDHWVDATAVHLSAFIMWRLNWIHPFSDGNGRTSRMVSYLVLSIKLGLLLPGKNTIPDQIVDNRGPYFSALEHADLSPLDGPYDLSEMEALLEGMLAKQLAGVMETATGKTFL